MKIVKALLGFAALSLWTAAAAAQDQDKEALKKKILQEVERRIRQEEDRLLREIERIIDEELARPKKEAPGVVPAPPQPPAQPKPQPAPKMARGYLGVRAVDLSADEKKELGVKGGLKLEEVVPGSPADKAGFKAGDVVVAIDGRGVDAAQDVRIIVAAAGPGASLEFDVLRDGKKRTIKVTLARHPEDSGESEPPGKEGSQARKMPLLDKLFALDEDTFEQLREAFAPLGLDLEEYFEKGADGKYRMKGDFAEMFKDFQKFFKSEPGAGPPEGPGGEPPKPAARPWMGIQVDELSEELRSQLDVEKDVGLLVAEVMPGGPAEKAGVLRHDVLLRIDGNPVKGEATLAGFMETARVGQEVTLAVLRKSKEMSIKVVLSERKEGK